MYPRIMYLASRFGGTLLGVTLLAIASLGYTTAQAALVTGSMGLTGGFTASGGTDLSDATLLELTSSTATSSSGDIAATVTPYSTTGTTGGAFSFPTSTPVTNLIQIGGWQIDLSTITIVDQTADLLNLAGTGTISGNSLDPTTTQWTLSANATGSSYSMTITAVPVPAALWLMGSGLALIGGIARRKSA